MARQETKLDILVGVQGTEKLRGLTTSLRGLSKGTVDAGTNTKKLVNNLKSFEATNVKSISNTRALANSYRTLARNVKFNSNRFKEATREANRLEKELRKMQATANKGMGRKGGLGNLAKIGGTVAAAGVFGGAEGAIGSAIGGVFGGVAGAAVGGAVGAQVGQFTGAIAEVAQYDAALEKQRRALKLVIGDTDKFNKSQSFLKKTSKDLAIPQDVIVRQFTSLTASVKGAGLSVEDAQKAFTAIASGIRGTGGSLEDMKSAMRATAQVFSKGKVSAEELRQQLGERLPGAFTLFAESMGKTPAELDKALEQGKVTLDDFMKFTTRLTTTYEGNAKKLALAPEAAGDRLKTEMSNLKDSLGDILIPIGAEFQATFASIVKAITGAIDAFKKFMGIGVENAIAKTTKELKRARETLENSPASNKRAKTSLERQIEELEARLESLQEEKDKEEAELEQKKTDNLKKQVTLLDNLKSGMQDYVNSIKDINKQIQDAVMSAFKNMEDALVKFTMTGKLNFNDFARSLIQDINRIIIRQKVMMPLLRGIDGLFNLGLDLNATGGVFGKDGKIQAYAKGGVVSQPTFFRYGAAGNLGLMGEAGAEAILPLKRGRSGNLGVESNGGGSTNIVVNVDASGSSVEGNTGQANEFGNVLAAAIQAELINQKRAGGLLSNA